MGDLQGNTRPVSKLRSWKKRSGGRQKQIHSAMLQRKIHGSHQEDSSFTWEGFLSSLTFSQPWIILLLLLLGKTLLCRSVMLHHVAVKYVAKEGWFTTTTIEVRPLKTHCFDERVFCTRLYVTHGHSAGGVKDCAEAKKEKKISLNTIGRSHYRCIRQTSSFSLQTFWRKKKRLRKALKRPLFNDLIIKELGNSFFQVTQDYPNQHKILNHNS